MPIYRILGLDPKNFNLCTDEFFCISNIFRASRNALFVGLRQIETYKQSTNTDKQVVPIWLQLKTGGQVQTAIWNQLELKRYGMMPT